MQQAHKHVKSILCLSKKIFLWYCYLHFSVGCCPNFIILTSEWFLSSPPPQDIAVSLADAASFMKDVARLALTARVTHHKAGYTSGHETVVTVRRHTTGAPHTVLTTLCKLK